MPLVNMRPLLEDARKRGYAIGGIEAWNLESAQAVIQAAEETRSPVVLLISGGIQHGGEMDPPTGIHHAGVDEFAAIGRVLAGKAAVPVALHFDECADFTLVMRCMHAGFTSVMFDGSALSFDENLRVTRIVTDVAHACDVTVEAQLGLMPTAEEGTDDAGQMSAGTSTDVAEAVRFAEATAVDALAVSVGNVHMMYRGQVADLDFGLASSIHEMTHVPLVMHGGSGVPDSLIPQAIRAGFHKINIGTSLYGIFDSGIREALDNYEGYLSTCQILRNARNRLKDRLKEKMVAYGSAGKA